MFACACACSIDDAMVDLQRKAMTLAAGFIMTESAAIGRLSGAPGLATSTIITSTPSRTQMYLSDSIVVVANEMFSAVTPRLVSCVIGRSEREKKEEGKKKLEYNNSLARHGMLATCVTKRQSNAARRS